MRYIAVHFYSFSTFMSNQYIGSTYEFYCPNVTQYPCYTSKSSLVHVSCLTRIC